MLTFDVFCIWLMLSKQCLVTNVVIDKQSILVALCKKDKFYTCLFFVCYIINLTIQLLARQTNSGWTSNTKQSDYIIFLKYVK